MRPSSPSFSVSLSMIAPSVSKTLRVLELIQRLDQFFQVSSPPGALCFCLCPCRYKPDSSKSSSACFMRIALTDLRVPAIPRPSTSCAVLSGPYAHSFGLHHDRAPSTKLTAICPCRPFGWSPPPVPQGRVWVFTIRSNARSFIPADTRAANRPSRRDSKRS